MSPKSTSHPITQSTNQPITNHPLYDLGYQELKDPALLLAVVRATGALLVDCRFSPMARDPRYRKAYLSNQLQHQYIWAHPLGNRNYKNGGPIEIVDLPTGLENVRICLKNSPVILMCACADRLFCHRLDLVNAVQAFLGVASSPITKALAQKLVENSEQAALL